MNMRTLFPQPREPDIQPMLVLVGLHRCPDGEAMLSRAADTLAACAQLLQKARAAAIPVGHVRRVDAPPTLQTGPRYPAWLPGFEPQRDDLVFDALQYSCYSSEEFGRAISYAGGSFALAGLFGETAGLSTAVDAFHAHHTITYLKDASRCGRHGALAPDTFRDAVTQILALYGDVADSDMWLRSVQHRRLAH